MTSRAGVAALALLAPATLLGFVLLRAPDLPQRFPDSTSYLQWQPSRSVGYPLLLSAVGQLDPSLGLLAPAQLGLFFGAALLLAEACRAASASLGLALFVAGGTLANVALARFALGVLSDAPFGALLTLHLACFLLVVRAPSPARWLALSLTLAAAVLVRPAGLSLLLGLPLVLLKRPRPAAAWTLLPCLALWLVAASANLVWRGSFALQEFGGLSLLGQVGSLIDGRGDARHGELVRQLADDLRPWREEAERQRWPEETVLFNAVAWNPMFQISSRRVGEYLDERGAESLGLGGLPRAAALNRLAGDVARQTILARPGRYLALVLAHLYGLWTIPQWTSAEGLVRTAARFDLQPPGPAPLEGLRQRHLGFLSARSALFLAAKRVVLAGLFAATLAGLVVPLRRLDDPESLAWLFASLNVHAGLGLVALANAALWRYSIVWWPYGLLAVGLAWRRLVAWRRARGRARPA